MRTGGQNRSYLGYVGGVLILNISLRVLRNPATKGLRTATVNIPY
jgi:hypothetical protein